ncbi:hypothetical protein MMC25_005177 [Agyrium rufum]|nr:hypothetical protein [Agyrium rufum]
MSKSFRYDAEKPAALPEQVRAEMSLEAGTGITRMHAAVHETMTVAALIASDYGLDRKTTFYNLRDNPKARSDVNDFIRGVVWNDDPACLLFDDNKDNNNMNYSTGAMWLIDFQVAKGGSITDRNIIGRSHFGDLSWLHGMGGIKGEWPTDTRTKITSYLEIMYKLACGDQGITPDTQLKDTWLRKYFSYFTFPTKYSDLRELLTANHKTPANIQHRAIGSCFHLLQDSYTHGHTRRVLLNPEDLDTSSPHLKFKPGSQGGKWGPVLNFHTYKGQDGDAHDHYDYTDLDMRAINPSNLDEFNGIVGARDAIELCITLANHWQKKTPWDGGVRQWLENTAFKIADGATASDESIE